MTGGFLSQAELKNTGTFGSFLLGRGSLSQKPGTQGTEIGVDGGLLFPPKYMARSGAVTRISSFTKTQQHR